MIYMIKQVQEVSYTASRKFMNFGPQTDGYGNACLKCEGFVTKNWGAKTANFVTVVISTKLCQVTKKDRSSYPPSVNARHDYGASRIRWHRIVNVNGTTEIKSLVSGVPRTQKFSVRNGIALSGLKWQYIVNCHIF